MHDPATLHQALAHHQAGRLAEAEPLYRALLAAQPDSGDLLHLLGVTACQRGEPATGERMIRRATALIRSAVVHSNLANAVHAQGRLDEAADLHRTALTLDPGSADARFALGGILDQQGRAEAIQAYQSALALNPGHAEACVNLGNLLHKQGQVAAAATVFHHSAALQPDNAKRHQNLALALLLLGRYEEGWMEYEWRWRTAEFAPLQPDTTRPLWTGDALEGKAILLYGEQGLGDMIQFARYAPLLAERGARPVLQVPGPLVRLMRSLGDPVRVIARGEPLPEIDLHCPLLSLPHHLGTTLATVPAAVPYLTAEAARVEAWQRRGTAETAARGLRVGIAWQGNPRGGRSIPLAAFAPLARVPGIRLISLQKGPGLEQLADLPAGMHVEQPGAGFDEGPDAFLDTAALMAGLDLVVTADTSVAHLAGALGRPVGVALGSVPDWRWHLERDDSPWYPTMRLFRRSPHEGWVPVFERIAAALSRPGQATPKARQAGSPVMGPPSTRATVPHG